MTPGRSCGSWARSACTEDDIVSLPVHHCYVRATVGIERMPAFSMMVRKPEEGDGHSADLIREAVSSYTLSAQDISFADAEAKKKVREYRDRAEQMENAGEEAEQ